MLFFLWAKTIHLPRSPSSNPLNLMQAIKIQEEKYWGNRNSQRTNNTSHYRIIINPASSTSNPVQPARLPKPLALYQLRSLY